MPVEVTKAGEVPDPRSYAASDFAGVHSGGIANHLYPYPQFIPPFGLYVVSGSVSGEIDSREGISAGSRPKAVTAARRNRRDALILQRQLQRQTP